MRELFDEVAGHSPLDPQEAVRRATRAPQRKRFYKEAGTAAADGGFSVTLDGKPIRTPSRRKVVAPTSGIAEAIAAEWNAQGETIDPLTMPLTRFANSVAEVTDRVDAVADDVAKYLGSDLLFYRAGHPDALVAREAAFWDPVLAWAANALGAHFILSEGIVHVTQPEQAIKAARGVFPADPWSVAALHLVTTVTGSALLALALFRGALDSDEVWAAAHVDDDWNVEKWGVDEEVAARRAARFIDFRAAVTVLDELRASRPPSG
jgi:chaperone required for assembly of F1-ATPase